MCRPENRVMVSNQREYVLQFRNDLPVARHFHAAGYVLVHLLHMIFCGLRWKPYNLRSQLQRRIHRLRIDSSHHAIQRNAAKHRKIIIAAMYDLIMAVAEIRAILCRALMCLDYDGTGSHTNRRFHQFKIVVCSLS